jgi:hypothetical protein
MNRRVALTLSSLLLLTGCGVSVYSTDAPSAGQEAATPAEPDHELLSEHDLTGMSAREIVEQLDRAEDKPADLMASVRYDELLVTDPSEPGQELALPIEGDEFYLSVAPYVDQTHDCYYHSLTTCQGELVEEALDVRITGADGTVLLDDTVTTYANGFVGFWLPRDIEAVLEVSYDGRTARTDVSTGPEDPTCLTTVRLA